MTDYMTTPWGMLSTTVEPIDAALAREMLSFYEEMLVPEIVCSPGKQPDRPHESWLRADGRKAVICRDSEGTLLACWVIKEHGIYYPCVNVMKGVEGVVALLRLMSYGMFEEEGEEMWASTSNRFIHQWAKEASTPEPARPKGMPAPQFMGDRIEWRS